MRETIPAKRYQTADEVLAKLNLNFPSTAEPKKPKSLSQLKNQFTGDSKIDFIRELNF
jgi:hypothetical protein